MIFWIDAQLPPAFAPWLTEEFAVIAHSMKWLGLRDAEDEIIFQTANF
jgi:predicted nuclease of predicted toxin-antitoxin system